MTTLIISIACLLGLCLGVLIERRRWVENADVIYRIEAGGKLYKVMHDEDYQP